MLGAIATAATRAGPRAETRTDGVPQFGVAARLSWGSTVAKCDERCPTAKLLSRICALGRPSESGRRSTAAGPATTDINIRLLLYRLWQTWCASGRETERPQSFVFMPHHNVVQEEAVLKQWGIGLLTEDAEDPEEALVVSLTKVKHRVEALTEQQESAAGTEGGACRDG